MISFQSQAQYSPKLFFFILWTGNPLKLKFSKKQNPMSEDDILKYKMIHKISVCILASTSPAPNLLIGKNKN